MSVHKTIAALIVMCVIIIGYALPSIAESEPEPSLNNWDYTSYHDDLTSGVIDVATVKSDNTVNFSFPYQGEQRASLIIRTHPRFGNDVILHINKGQFLARNHSCIVNMRFDNSEIKSYAARTPNDYSHNSIFIVDYKEFIKKMMQSKSLKIEALFYHQGAQVFTFNVSNYAP